jgi:hypothetical protein
MAVMVSKSGWITLGAVGRPELEFLEQRRPRHFARRTLLSFERPSYRADLLVGTGLRAP